MGVYTTIEITPEFARTFLIGKIMQASDEKLESLMDAYGDEEPYFLNNFRVVEHEGEE